jgi:hypothetical protein
MPFDRLRRLAQWSELRSVDVMAVFALTRAGLLRAAQRGGDPRKFKEFLTAHSRNPLPQPVAFQLDELAARMGEIEIVPCSALVRVKDPALLKVLGHGLVPVSDLLAILPSGSDQEEVAAALQKAGYLPRLCEAGPDGGAMAPAAAADPARPQTIGDIPEFGSETSHPGQIDALLRFASEVDGAVRIVLRGGRRETLFVEEYDGSRLEGDDVRTGRRLVVSADSIVTAKLCPGM